MIGGVAHDASGRSGPSPVDQVLEANITAHEKRLVTQWEATKDASVLRRQNRQAYEQERDRRRIAAANQSQLSLDLVGEQLNAAIAGLGPEKQAAARQAADAAIKERRAQLQQQTGQLYDAISKRSEVDRTFGGDGTGAGGKLTQGQGELAGALTSMTTELKKFQGVRVSQDALRKWQQNQTLIGGDEKTASQGSLGARVVAGLRWAKLTPEQEFSDISDADKSAILSRKRGLDQLSKIMTGAAATDSEVKRREQQWLIQPGDSDEIIAEKTQAFMDFIRDRAVAAGGAAPLVQRNLESATAPTPAGPAAAQPAAGPDLSKRSNQEIVAAMATLARAGDKANPAHKKLLVEEMKRRGLKK